jgi:hypothetical protein
VPQDTALLNSVFEELFLFLFRETFLTRETSREAISMVYDVYSFLAEVLFSRKMHA